jgi:hypothetical protein
MNARESTRGDVTNQLLMSLQGHDIVDEVRWRLDTLVRRRKLNSHVCSLEDDVRSTERARSSGVRREVFHRASTMWRTCSFTGGGVSELRDTTP